MSWVTALTLLATLPQAFASCAYGTHLHRRAEPGHFEEPTFGYSGAKGPANWFNLDPEVNSACATGQRQSPIDMTKGSFNLVPSSELELDIPDFTEGAEFENLGTTIEVIAEDLGATLKIAETSYSLKQFHFHLPSEHLDDGTSMAMEMHMVWASEESELAVIGVYIDLDDEAADAACSANESVATKAKHLGRRAGVATHSAMIEAVLGSSQEIATPGSTFHTEPLVMSELVDLLKAGSFQSYGGSLTTPPCSEGVRWLVSNQKVSISTSAYLKARSVIGYNARFPQNAPGQKNILNIGRETSDDHEDDD